MEAVGKGGRGWDIGERENEGGGGKWDGGEGE